MITEIIIDDVASYISSVKIGDLKKFNLFYGLNGTGKSTLGQYLAIAKNDTSEGKFRKCKASFSNGADQLQTAVYNQNFIRENFLEIEDQKGIFTLDHTNTEAVTAIAEADAKILTYQTQKIPLEEKQNAIKNTEDTEKNKLIDLVWEDKKSFERSSLYDCMKGFLKKADFFEKVLSSTPSEAEVGKIGEAFDALKTEMDQFKDNTTNKAKTYLLLLEDLSAIEDNPIWAQKITGGEDSYLSEIIHKLSHTDWVIKGINNYIDNTDSCPFCAQPIDEALKIKMRQLIDDTYKEKLGVISDLKKSYAHTVKEIDESTALYQTDEKLANNADLQSLMDKLRLLLKTNSGVIDKKHDAPAQTEKLEATNTTILAINKIIEEHNKLANAFNERLDNRKEAIQKCTSDFWMLLNRKHFAAINDYKSQREQRRADYKKCIDELAAIQKLIDVQDEVIAEQQKLTKNIQESVNRINYRLKSFGMDGFEIEPVKEPGANGAPFYKIVRKSPSGHDKEFETLSEGEKTLITFLYFVELCRSTEIIEGKSIGPSNRIVVIDDPISSLSFNLVFDVSTIIKSQFLSKDSPYLQIFILTHHLYFLHEINMYDKDYFKGQAKLYRVTKSDRTSISVTERGEIMNTYQSYWQIIKDAKTNPALANVLPNAMRNILEHYFSFIHGEEKLAAALGDLAAKNDNPAFFAFLRCISRQSHSDSTNLIDMREIDIAKFIPYFKEVFDKTGYGPHHDKMIEAA